MKSLLGKLEQWIERAILIAVIGLLLIPTLITNRLRDAAKMEDAVKEAAVTDAASRVGKEPSVVVETLDRVESAATVGKPIEKRKLPFIPPEVSYGKTSDIFVRRLEGIKPAPPLRLDLPPAPVIGTPGFIVEGGPLSGFQNIRRDRSGPRTIDPNAAGPGAK
jgi:hypothetical protein